MQRLKKTTRYVKLELIIYFPGKHEIFADWFSGEIRIPTGKLLKYIHLGYQSIFEKDIFLNFKDGILLSETIKDNQLKS